MALTVASSARPAAAFEMSACLAIASINSDLFTASPFPSNVKRNPLRASRARFVLRARTRR